MVTINGHSCLDHQCAKRWCWTPGLYQHRGATGGGGSRNTGMTTKCCLHRAYHGCPDPIPGAGEKPPWDTAFTDKSD